MRHSSISKNRVNNFNDHVTHQQRRWPSCKQSKITNNSVLSDPCDKIIEKPKPCISKYTSLFNNIFSESEDYYNYGFLKDNESLEKIILGVKSSSSGRLFFEPEQTKSISRSENKYGGVLPFKESVQVVMDSKDPYGDFKKSMQEMIESHGLNNLECLEKLLGWYLSRNDERHHQFIIEAFVDMFLEFVASSSSSHSCSSVFSAILSTEEVDDGDRIN
ncbi:hypothetical protein LIER_00621 [Lithospermum erythrorhizon]|uniref:Transcription repressor n=1 Tax=Lithospermum erythrorhizon TaxID=34254 RepID=A0AAV3NI10_LITER